MLKLICVKSITRYHRLVEIVATLTKHLGSLHILLSFLVQSRRKDSLFPTPGFLKEHLFQKYVNMEPNIHRPKPPGYENGPKSP